MISACRNLSLAIVIVLVASFARGQAATGTPPWSSLEGGPDVVNLGNLNVHLVYPVFHKAGRQLPFNYDLTNDSSFWYPVTNNGTTFWNPVPSGGWSGSPLGVGNLYFSYITDGSINDVLYYNFYYDSAGTGHPFPVCAYSNGSDLEDTVPRLHDSRDGGQSPHLATGKSLQPSLRSRAALSASIPLRRKLPQLTAPRRAQRDTAISDALLRRSIFRSCLSALRAFFAQFARAQVRLENSEANRGIWMVLSEASARQSSSGIQSSIEKRAR